MTMKEEGSGALVSDDDVHKEEEEEDGAVEQPKTKHRARKASPKPRSRHASGESREPRSPKKHLPSNPGRAQQLPSNPERARSPRRNADKSPPRDRRQHGHHSPKRNKSHEKLEKRSPSPKAYEEKISEGESSLSSPARAQSPPGATEREAASEDLAAERDNNKSPMRVRTESGEGKPRRQLSPRRSPRSQSPRKERVHSPKKGRAKSPTNTTSSRRGDKPASKEQHSRRTKLREPSLTLPGGLGDESEETDEESTASKNPRYISPKGHTTHLQLQFDPNQKDLPIFSLLDESNNLLNDEPSLQFEPLANKADKDNNKKSKTTTTVPQQTHDDNDDEPFPSWGNLSERMDEDDEDDDVGHTSHNSSVSSPKSPSRSPLAVRKAMKALKYTKPSLSSAVGKLSTGFQNTLGFANRHRHLNDDDDLAELIE